MFSVALGYCTTAGRVKPTFDYLAYVALSQYESTYYWTKLESSSLSGGKRLNKWSNLLLQLVDGAWVPCGRVQDPFLIGDTGKTVRELLSPLQ